MFAVLHISSFDDDILDLCCSCPYLVYSNLGHDDVFQSHGYEYVHFGSS